LLSRAGLRFDIAHLDSSECDFDSLYPDFFTAEGAKESNAEGPGKYHSIAFLLYL